MKTYNLKQSVFKVIKKPSLINLESLKINSSKEAEKVFRSCYDITSQHLLIVESFFVLFLNRANSIIAFQHVSTGGISGTIVDPKIIYKHAIDCLASGIILCHNHPSGNLKVSQADKDLTAKIKSGAKILDLELLDHIIITEDSYLSFSEEGIL